MKKLLLLASLILVSACAGHSGMPPTDTGGIGALPPLHNGSIRTTKSVTQSSECHVSPAGTTTSSTLACTVSSGQFVVATVYLHAANLAPTAPTGFTELCHDSNTGGSNEIYAYKHSVGSGDTGSYAFSWGSTAKYNHISGEVLNGAADVDKANCAHVTGTATMTTAALTPTSGTDLPIAFFANSNNNHVPTITSGWTDDEAGNTGAIYLNVQRGPGVTGSTTASVTYDSAPSTGIEGALILVSAATTTGSPYTYHGVSVYTANDWFTTDLTGTCTGYVSCTVDPNSSTILSYISGLYGTIAWYTAPNDEAVNLATNSTTLHTVGGCVDGCDNDPYNDDPSPFSYPVTSPNEYEEGALTGGCTGDCHDITLNTDTGVDYEAYTSGQRNWDGTSFTTEGAFVVNLNHSYNDQFSSHGGIVTAAGLPLLGTTNFGEDASASSINHSIGFFLPNNGEAQNGRVDPAEGSEPCQVDCAHTIPYGARLRLHASFTCPPAASYPQANKFCIQLKTYGAILLDVNSTTCTTNEYGHAGDCLYGFRFAEATDGTQPWHGDGCCPPSPLPDLDEMLYPTGAYYLHLTDFDIMTLGTIH